MTDKPETNKCSKTVKVHTVSVNFSQLLCNDIHMFFVFFITFLLLNPPLLSFSIRDFDSLNEEDHAANLQLAFDISEREFGIRPFASVKELSDDQELDKTRMITFLSKFYELFRGTPLPASGSLPYSTFFSTLLSSSLISALYYTLHEYTNSTCNVLLNSTVLDSALPTVLSAIQLNSTLFHTTVPCLTLFDFPIFFFIVLKYVEKTKNEILWKPN